jgi:hypothetical protein
MGVGACEVRSGRKARSRRRSGLRHNERAARIQDWCGWSIRRWRHLCDCTGYKQRENDGYYQPPHGVFLPHPAILPIPFHGCGVSRVAERLLRRDERERGGGTRMTEGRRFPPPWTIEDHGACFIVRDKNGQALGYFYFEQEPGRPAAANLLTWRRTSRSYQPIVAVRRAF